MKIAECSGVDCEGFPHATPRYHIVRINEREQQMPRNVPPMQKVYAHMSRNELRSSLDRQNNKKPFPKDKQRIQKKKKGQYRVEKSKHTNSKKKSNKPPYFISPPRGVSSNHASRCIVSRQKNRNVKKKTPSKYVWKILKQ